MANKSLGNNIAIAAILLLLGGGGIYLYSKFSPKPGEIRKVSQNRFYNEIYDNANELREKPWDKSEYTFLSSEIEAYEEDGLLNTSEKKDLHEFLETKYLGTLIDTVANFCRRGWNNQQLKDLRSELESFEGSAQKGLAKESQRHLRNFSSVKNTIYQANKYAKSETYDKTKTDRYFSSLDGVSRKAFLGDNPKVRNGVAGARTSLGKHRGMARKFESEYFQVDTCNCERHFGANTLYKAKCIEIQQASDSTSLMNTP